MTPVGNVKEINLYPVKSMAGSSAASAELYWYGLNGDRKYAFVQQGKRSGFPWLTARELPELLRYRPHFTNPERPMQGEVRVTSPEGETFELTSAGMLEHLQVKLPQPISLLNLNRGTFDVAPVSVISTGTLGLLDEALNGFDTRRLRMNLVLELDAPRAEEAWIGKKLRLGSGPDAAELYLRQRDKRCTVINLDPDTG